eukprot:5233118-Alexandrium_andersonii.AAC.1
MSAVPARPPGQTAFSNARNLPQPLAASQLARRARRPSPTLGIFPSPLQRARGQLEQMSAEPRGRAPSNRMCPAAR